MPGADRAATAGSDQDRSVGNVRRSSQVRRSSAKPDPGVGELRKVGVEIDHPRHEHPRPQVDGGFGFGGPVPGGPRVGQPAIGVDDDQTVRIVSHATRRKRRQQPRPDRERRSIGKLRAHAREASTQVGASADDADA